MNNMEFGSSSVLSLAIGNKVQVLPSVEICRSLNEVSVYNQQDVCQTERLFTLNEGSVCPK